MTKKSDFYILSATNMDQVHLFACKLIEKAFHKGHKIFVYCETEHEAHTLDELLWSFEPKSFIPHHLQGEGPNAPPPVQIGFGEHASGFNDICINLSQKIPAFIQQFQRVFEIVPQIEEQKQIKRQHFRYYKEQHYTVQSHTISN